MRWRRCLCPLLGLMAWIAAAETTVGFAEGFLVIEDHPLLVFSDCSYLLRNFYGSTTESAPTNRTPCLQFFRMPSAALTTPLGIYPDDDPPPEDGKSQAADDDLNFMQITYGAHIPYLDMYRKGDPGGVGYYKVHSQVQIFDAGTTNVSAVLQAFTPMGLQNGGVNNGRTVVSPALTCFQDLGDGAALHAFIGQDLCTSARSRDQVQAGYRCGLALQQAIPLTAGSGEQGFFVFVQALGQYQTDAVRADGKTAAWDVIPGVQYRISNACWMSVGISCYSFLSCVWQY